jgi:beta-galactosidase
MYTSAAFIGKPGGQLHAHLQTAGIAIAPLDDATNLLIIEAKAASATDLQQASSIIETIRRHGGLIWIMFTGKTENTAVNTLIPAGYRLTDRQATALEPNKSSPWGKYFDLPRLYFAEADGDRQIIKCGLSGDIIARGKTVLTASRTDWSLFNQQAENKKCAQIVLYEQLEKPSGVALLTLGFGKGALAISTLDYRIQNRETAAFWKTLFAAMQIDLSDKTIKKNETSKKNHDLLLDGPVN